jgi:hypothetical protein
MSANFKPHRGIINATVNDGNLQKAILKDKNASGEGVREYVRQSRFHNRPGDTKNLVTQLPADEEYLANGDVRTTRSKTKTVRRSH